jgi:hypothetical protein
MGRRFLRNNTEGVVQYITNPGTGGEVHLRLKHKEKT